jgi:transposase-like protein
MGRELLVDIKARGLVVPPEIAVGDGAMGFWQADTCAAARTALDTFAEKHGAKYENAVTCLTKDREALLTFYDFPGDHLDHLRTGNPLESVFATVRHRTVRTKATLSQKTAKLMVFKLVEAAAKTWLRLKGADQLPLVLEAVTFTDGVAANDTANRAA